MMRRKEKGYSCGKARKKTKCETTLRLLLLLLSLGGLLGLVGLAVLGAGLVDLLEL